MRSYSQQSRFRVCVLVGPLHHRPDPICSSGGRVKRSHLIRLRLVTMSCSRLCITCQASFEEGCQVLFEMEQHFRFVHAESWPQVER